MTHKFNPFRQLFVAIVSVALCFTNLTQAQTTSFNYQGSLSNGGSPANGNYDLQFKLYDALSGGNQIGATLTQPTVQVSNGNFSVLLDFGATVFDGSPRYLEIGVRPAGNTDPYVILAPRQIISSSPYAIRTLSATAADSLSLACIGCVTDAHIQTLDGAKITGTIAGSQISGTIPGASLPTDSPYYIQNSAALLRFGKNSIRQTASFDIDGNGAVGGNFITNGRLGIGTSEPTTSLHVAGGISWFQGDAVGLPAAAGKGVAIGYSGTVDRGYLFAYDYATGSPRNLLLNHPGGNVGIGTLFPTSKLEIAAQDGLAITGFNPFLTLRDTGNGGRKSYIQGVNGDLAFIPQSFSPNGVAMVVKDISGNVGIGTATPSTKLQIVGGNTPGIHVSTNVGNAILAYSTASTFDSIYGENLATSGIGVHGQGSNNFGTGVKGDGFTGVKGTSSQPQGIGVSGVGLALDGIGVQGTSSSGYAMYAAGNAGQSMYAGGWVKAMVYVDPSLPTGQQIVRCYNSQTTAYPANNPPCGFTAQGIRLGYWVVTFPFNVENRFASVTLSDDGELLSHPKAVDIEYWGNTIIINISFSEEFPRNRTNAPFTLIVY